MIGKRFRLKPRTEIPRRTYILLSLVGIMTTLLFWSVLTYTGLVKEVFLTDPVMTFQRVYVLFAFEDIFEDARISLIRVVIGFSIAAVIGIPMGVLSGLYKPIEAFIEANISFLRFIPVAAFIPLAILWLGISEQEKIFLIFIGVLPYTVLYVSAATANIEKQYLEVASTFGVKGFRLLTKVIVPRTLPHIWDICRIEMGGAWAYVILAEVVAANAGLGYRLVIAQRFLQTANIFATIIIIGIIGLSIDMIFKFTYNRLFPWAEKSKISQS